MTYPAIANLLDGAYSRESMGEIVDSHVFGTLAVLSAGVLIGGIKSQDFEHPQFRGHGCRPEGTFFGWLASLPIKGVISAYEGIKNYVENAIAKDKNQRSEVEV